MHIELIIADYTNPQHSSDLISLLDAYARDPMGGGEPLTEHTRKHLAEELAKCPTAVTVLCYVDSKPAGLANCFETFSTFKCAPILNVHDVVVLPEYRGHGLSQKMLNKVEAIARERGCCKLTLEVLEGNAIARQAYNKFGFTGYSLDPAMGSALFWQKLL